MWGTGEERVTESSVLSFQIPVPAVLTHLLLTK